VRASGSAERLQRSEGAWRLEFQQLVYSSPTLLRPRRFSVLGEQAILQQLRELNGHEPLARDAERLFGRGAIPDGAYVVRDGRWFPELAPERLREPDPPPPLEEERAGKEAQSTATRGVLEELVKRVVSLEDTVRDMQESLERALTALSQVAASPQAFAQTATAAAPPMAATLRSSASPPPQPSASAAPALEDSGKKSIALPPISALSDLVRGLAGPDASISQGERTDWAHISGTQPVFFAVVQDHNGDEAGSMIFDLEAALRLAGALLMESEEMIESLLEEKVMSDEMLDAASEVCNTMTSAFNKVSGNPHLRAGKMQPFTEARSIQLASVRKRDDYRYNQGGRLSLVAV
jgi:hypothetical protein